VTVLGSRTEVVPVFLRSGLHCSSANHSLHVSPHSSFPTRP